MAQIGAGACVPASVPSAAAEEEEAGAGGACGSGTRHTLTKRSWLAHVTTAVSSG
jgi:hypothetical protein